jgi:hydroxylamine reductase (hybrid-cluster protein)
VLLGQRSVDAPRGAGGGKYLHQELAVVTGAVDALIVDVQCEMQALENVAKCYHTKLITTDDRAKMPLATHIAFDEHHALDVARKILREAIDNYPNCKAPVMIPSASSPTIVGFSYETIQYLLGGKWDFENDPILAAKKMIAHIDLNRKALGIDKARERVLMDMEMRRTMDAAVAGEEH